MGSHIASPAHVVAAIGSALFLFALPSSPIAYSANDARRVLLFSATPISEK